MRPKTTVWHGIGAMFGGMVTLALLLPATVALGALTGWVLEAWFPRTSQLWLSVLLPWENVHLYQFTALAAFVVAYLRSILSALKPKD